VPRLDWDTHRLAVSGLVANPRTFSMHDLVAMPAREVDVMLVCAGNRRKEQNMIAQGVGFSWGPSAVSVSKWKGVSLRDLLLAVGIHDHYTGFVCFEGADKLPGGFYGTLHHLSTINISLIYLIVFRCYEPGERRLGSI